MAARALARRNLIDFITYTFPSYRPEPVHHVIARHLEAVLRGDIKRLLISAPPQTGKSELVSVRFPAFWLAHRPDDPVILCSYGSSLAHSLAWEARNVVDSPAFRSLFRVRVSQTSRAKERWRLHGRKGGMVAAGVGGPITGHGAMLGIIDDPFKDWQEAMSPTTRERVWNWYRSTFRTRIWEGGAIVIVQTRWVEDDLVGRLLSSEQEDWVMLRLPALAETPEERAEAARILGVEPEPCDPLLRRPGEPLCPGRFSKETLEAIREDVGSYVSVSYTHLTLPTKA